MSTFPLRVGLILAVLGASIPVSPSPALACGVQSSPDGLRAMANRDVGDERWAITRHPSGVVTGNVFRGGGQAPAFIVCTPTGAPNQFMCLGGDGCLAPASAPGASPRGVSISPVGGILLANKDVGSQRWAITQNEDGTLTGNVFATDGSPPAFIYCEPNDAPDSFTCFGSDACGGAPCGDDFALIGDVTLPPDFLERPEPCDDAYDVIGNAIELPPSFFLPEGCRQPACGDGVLDAGEACDDGNLLSGDGCDGQCAIEPLAPCADISGGWNVTETGEVTCEALGERITEPINGGAHITIVQDGCDVRYTVPGVGVQRTGRVDGNSVTFTGPFLLSNGEIDFTINESTASGTVMGDTIVLDGEGRAEGRVQGVRVRCFGNSRSVMRR